MADISFTNLPAFERDLRAFLKDRVQPEVAIILKKTAFTLGSHLIFGTPVDFGHARGGWQTRLGSPANSQADRKDPGGSAAIAEMNAVLARIRDSDPYQVVWYFNNAPYIDDLDQGGFQPANPATDEASLARRRARRSPKDRKRALRVGGHEGAPLIKDGYSLQAPAGIVDAALAAARRELFG